MFKGILPISHCPTQERENETLSPPRRRSRGDWQRLAHELATPGLELDPETFAGIVTVYERERRAGRPMDPVLTALLLVLARAARTTDDGHEDFEDELDEQHDEDDDSGTDDHPLPMEYVYAFRNRPAGQSVLFGPQSLREAERDQPWKHVNIGTADAFAIGGAS